MPGANPHYLCSEGEVVGSSGLALYYVLFAFEGWFYSATDPNKHELMMIIIGDAP